MRHLATARALATAMLSIALGATGCSDDGGMDLDAGTADADGPTELTFETQATDLATGLALFDVTVTEVGTANTAQSAPNGRAVLTVPRRAIRVSHELAGYLTNTMSVDPNALASHNAANVAVVSDLITATDLDDLYSGIGVVRDAQTTQLFLYVNASNFTAATEVSVTVSGGGQSFVRGPGGFEAGNMPLLDPLLIVPNVTGTSATVSFSASCPGAATVALEAGEIVSALYVCDPSL